MSRKTDKVILLLVIFSILLIVFALFAPYFFTQTKSGVNFNNTGQIGDTIGGLMNPFIALAGILVTFLAFYMQLKANKIQVEQFNSVQEEQLNLMNQQIFFRGIDSLNQKVVNFTFSQGSVNNSRDYTSFSAIDQLLTQFRTNMDYKCLMHGRQLLVKYPDTISELYYFKIMQAQTYADPNTIQSEAEKLKKTFCAIPDFNDRWEFIKDYIGSIGSGDEKRDALLSIGRVYFYKTSFEDRYDMYETCYDEMYASYGGFLDSYMKALGYLLEFTDQIKPNIFFTEYLRNAISTQEAVLIFYYCASRKSNRRFRSLVKKTDLLSAAHNVRGTFTDAPSEEELNREIGYILDKA